MRNLSFLFIGCKFDLGGFGKGEERRLLWHNAFMAIMR